MTDQDGELSLLPYTPKVSWAVSKLGQSLWYKQLFVLFTAYFSNTSSLFDQYFKLFFFSRKKFTDLFFRDNHSFRVGEQNVIIALRVGPIEH